MAKQDLLLAIDQGTTGTTALLVNEKLRVLASRNVEFPQIYPQPGWVEHDLEAIWRSTLKALRAVVGKTYAGRIAAIGITNQRETACFWSRKTGKPLGNAIVWQDRRTSAMCKEWKDQGREEWIHSRTGLLLDPYFSGTKVKWALENHPGIGKAARDGDCAFGTIDSFLVNRLTGGVEHVTEPSNASRTLLFNLQTLKWDDELLKFFGVPRSILPEVRGSTALLGKTRKVPGLPDGIPIHGMLGDQQAALLGQACIEEGTAKCTYGTGSFLLLNTGKRIVRSKAKLLSTVAWSIGGEVAYALEGGAFTAGASVQWLRDGLGLFKKSADVEALAKKVKTSDGVIFVPAFVGIGAPHWMPDARAAFFGITRGTTRSHIARAVLEGIAFMNHDILKAMQSDLGAPLRTLGVDGGACKNNLLMQFQADLLGCELRRPKMVETTALGAVFAAGLGVGVWRGLEDVRKSWVLDRSFQPTMAAADRATRVTHWNQAIQALAR